ncbi:ScyD/ScyE family protein [Dyadobacter sp. CY261]|uniref:ScyD/ScyE family protein n=1 Tax=Dyadobacter sp. CY261 TaxID=2907203 RepID=UPI001F218D59|nr:ScyD/ScyE family protein [Dyadobacter sp. CY261]MCF0068889.1 ScyD/ScyE family protein [Dyadobacter sp. CY261]
MKKHFLSLLAFTLMVAMVVMDACTDHAEPIPEPTQFSISPFASGLRAPIGLVADDQGRFWVTEGGTGADDGALVMISPQGVKTTVVTNFKSVVNQGNVEGISHLYYDNGTLYLLHGVEGLLYTINVADLLAGSLPLHKDHLATENIKAYVVTKNLTFDNNSNAFAMTKGPDGHLYIVDAGANAIIKRDKDTHVLDLFATFPPVGPGRDPVPTGIVFDGSHFILSSLTGFPFSPGSANVYKVNTSGALVPYKSGFTTLTHLTLTVNGKPLLLHYADFVMPPGGPGNPPGFKPGTGSILNEDGTVLLSGLDRPTDIKRHGDRTFYVLSLGDGTIKRLDY